jgi:hypothetical protein
MHRIVSAAWDCDAASYRLDQKNRFYYVRGISMFVMLTSRDGLNFSLIDPLLDRHLMWVGSRFDELKPNLEALLIGNNFSREWVELVAAASKNVQEYVGSSGYDRDGYFSVVPEDTTTEFDTQETITVPPGVDVPVLYYVYMAYHESRGFAFNTILNGLGDLVSELDTSAEDNGRFVLTMMSLNSDMLRLMTEVWADYSAVDRDALFDSLDMRFARHDPSRDTYPLSDDALAATIIMPVIRAFSDSQDSHITVDVRNERILNLSDQFMEIWADRGDDRANASSFNQYVARCRALAMHFMVNDGIVPEHDSELEQLGNTMSIVCRNATALLHSKDLSLKAVRTLS